jgi:4-hydroxybenzoate polyprenyltransferase
MKLPGWLKEGRAGLKARVADQGVLDPETLPFNQAVVEMVRAAREEGRKTVLVSAADHRQVTAVAEATRLFDEAYGTAEGLNLKGQAKADFLTERFGAFDYVGDSLADIPVWSAARHAITVQADPKLRNAARDANASVSHIDPPEARWRHMFRAMRPHQWSKNALLFVPLLAAHSFSALPQVIFALIAFCLTASAVYVLNDLVDLSADRAHPRKRLRPFASGALSARTGVLLSAGLLIAALFCALLVGKLAFLGVLAAYLVSTFLYSLWLKRKLIVDVLTLAGLYTIRVVAGGVAAGVVLSPWLLGFSMFLFLALAAIKRQAELDDQMRSGRESAGRAYEVEDLPILRSLAVSANTAAVLVLALYISSDAVQELYPRPELLWLICPILLYWTTRMVMKAHRGLMTDDPIVFAVTDRLSALLIVISASVALSAAL